MNFLIPFYTPVTDDRTFFYIERFIRELEAGEVDALERLRAFFAGIPYELNGSADEALQQIDDCGYLIPYIADGRTLIKVGVSFDAAERNIGEWKVASCPDE